MLLNLFQMKLPSSLKNRWVVSTLIFISLLATQFLWVPLLAKVYTRGLFESRRDQLLVAQVKTVAPLGNENGYAYGVVVHAPQNLGRLATVSPWFTANREPRVNDWVLIGSGLSDSPYPIIILDYWRLPQLILLGVLFILLVCCIAGRSGVLALLGLLFAVCVVWFIYFPLLFNYLFFSPAALMLLVLLVAVPIIMFLSHGRDKSIVAAVVAVEVLLLLSFCFVAVVVAWFHFSGFADLPVHIDQSMGVADSLGLKNMASFLVATVLIALAGVLDDITINQAVVWKDMQTSNPVLPYRELYQRVHNVGREHILSLVNTLFFVYAGAVLFNLVVIARVDVGNRYLVFTSEEFIQQVVVLVLASIVTILAVPVGTFFAGWFLYQKEKR
jgi:uncharacterized membrane protein